MHVQSLVGNISGLHGVTTRRRGQPRKNTGHIGDDTSKEHQEGTKLE